LSKLYFTSKLSLIPIRANGICCIGVYENITVVLKDAFPGDHLVNMFFDKIKVLMQIVVWLTDDPSPAPYCTASTVNLRDENSSFDPLKGTVS
jgi:hypothetical protein